MGSSDKGRAAWSPFVVGEVMVDVPLASLNVEVELRTERNLRLLEWAMMAPLRSFGRPLSLTAISRQLKIPVEFLDDITKTLHILDIVEGEVSTSESESTSDALVGFHSGDPTANEPRYQLTAQGQAMFDKGSILGDPRMRDAVLVYSPTDKEWLVGTEPELDVSKLIVQDVDPMPDIVPLPLVEKHLRLMGAVSKDDIVYGATVHDEEVFRLEIRSRVILLPNGLEARAVSQPFGKQNESLINKLLTRAIREDPAVVRRLFDQRQSSFMIPATLRKVRPHELPIDRLLFNFDEGPKALEEALNDRHDWCMVSDFHLARDLMDVDRCPSLFIVLGSDPANLNGRDVWYQGMDAIDRLADGERTGHDPSTFFGSTTLFVHQPMAFAPILQTRSKSLEWVHLVADNVDLPLMILGDSDPRELVSYILGRITDQLAKGDDLRLAVCKCRLEPSGSNLDEVFRVLNRTEIKAQHISKVLAEVVKLRGRVRPPATSKDEFELFTTLVSNMAFDELLDVPDEVILALGGKFTEAIRKRLDEEKEHSVDEIDRWWAMARTRSIGTGATGCQQVFQDIHTFLTGKVVDGWIREVSERGGPGFDGACKVLLSVPEGAQRARLLEALRSAFLEDRSISEDFAHSVSRLQRLSDAGLKVGRNELEMVATQAFETPPLDLYEPKLRQRVREALPRMNKLAKGTKFVAIRDLPSLTRVPRDRQEVRTVIGNLKALSIEVSGASHHVDIQLCRLAELIINSLENERTGLLITYLNEAGRSFRGRPWPIGRPELIRQVAEEAPDIDGLSKELKELGIYKQVMEQRSKKGAGERAVGLVIDGSNVALNNRHKNAPSAEQLITAYKELRNVHGFSDILIIVDASLRHMDGKEYNKMEIFFREEEKARGGISIFQQAPAKQSADDYIIDIARKGDLLILTNDLYRDHIQKSPDLAEWLPTRLIKYNIANNKLSVPNMPMRETTGGAKG